MGGRIIDLLCRCFSLTPQPALCRQDTPHSWKSDRTETHYGGNSNPRGDTVVAQYFPNRASVPPGTETTLRGNILLHYYFLNHIACTQLTLCHHTHKQLPTRPSMHTRRLHMIIVDRIPHLARKIIVNKIPAPNKASCTTRDNPHSHHHP